jgi:hypothetical protein
MRRVLEIRVIIYIVIEYSVSLMFEEGWEGVK